MSYTLLDGVAQHERHPETFQVPDAEIVMLLGPGDCVKLGFQAEQVAEGDYGGERMWVRVTHNGGQGRWTGTLANTPVVVDLEFGDEVAFVWENVIDWYVEGLS